MYVPQAFLPASDQEMHDVISRSPFATLITAGPGGPAAVTHLPLLLDRDTGAHGTLVGHLARGNPHAEMLAGGWPTTAVFHGPQAYVSPAWYEQEPSLPTWNYVAVHAGGRPLLREEPGHLLALLRRTTIELERSFGDSTPWELADDNDSVDRFINEIVAFDLPLDTLEGAFKLSQNVDAALRARVRAGLRNRNDGQDRLLADLMDASERSRRGDA